MSKTVYVFIDAANLWQAQKVKGKFFDFVKLPVYLRQRYNAIELKVFYYTAFPADGSRTYSLDNKHKFFTFLKKKLGFTVRKKELKQIKTNTTEGFIIEEKGNMDVEMTIDAVHLVNKYDIAVFFTGDSDFLGLVKYLRARGRKVYIFSSRNSVSSELLTGADGYVDVLRIKDDIWGSEVKFREQR